MFLLGLSYHLQSFWRFLGLLVYLGGKMRCLKILRRHWICSIFVFSFFSLLSLFGLSHDSYATSITCSATDYSVSSGSTVSISTFCPNWFTPDVDNVGFSSPLYFYDLDVTVNYISGNPYTRIDFMGLGNSHSAFSLQRLSSSLTSDSLSIDSVFYVSNRTISGSSIYFGVNGIQFGYPASYTFTFNVTNDYSDISSGSSQPCPVCPVIPENPYDNKFDAITKAIYTCGAVLIMLYFFFCIYKIIVKDGGSR